MKLNFHYFTIKFIASRAGYSEQEAQLIATACQFINDNREPAALHLTKDQLSEAIKKRHLYEDDPSKGPNACKIPLLLTALSEDNLIEALKSEENQEERLIPFYYFPDSATDKKSPTFVKANYRVFPIETLQSNYKFSELFEQAKKLYSAANRQNAAARQALRRLGVLLHIASDSIFYEPFNGYMSNVNRWKIAEVKDTRTFKTITEQYEPQKYADYPNVGKYRTSRVTEDYNRQFILTREQVSYTRINNDTYVRAAKSVYSFLANFLGKDPSEQEWRDNIYPYLVKCWNTDSYQYEELVKQWSQLTNVSYDYDEDVVRLMIMDIDTSLNPEEQGYFDFLLMLQDVKDTVHNLLKKGENDMLTSDEQTIDSVKCSISDPIFKGDSYELALAAKFPTKLSSMVMQVSIMDSDTQEQIKSDLYSYKNINAINEKLMLAIPTDKQNLLAIMEFSYGDDTTKNKAYQKEYSIIGNAAIIMKQELLEPKSHANRPAIQIVNGSESHSADYHFPLNAMYISQEGVAQLDLFTPIHLQVKLEEGFKLSDYEQLAISLTLPNGHAFKYCNNSKFITLNMDEETSIIHIAAHEEWKNRIPVRSFSASIAKLKLGISVILEVSSDSENGYRNIVVDTRTDDSLVTDIELLWNV